jgi:predicted RND superfamily exporter protein
MIKSSKIDVEKLNTIITEIKSSDNQELVQAMDFLTEDFEETKQMIVNLSIHLDNVENLYNKILVEYNSRNNYE